MKSKLLNYVALDLGGSKISAIAAHIDKKGNVEILSSVLHHSAGIKSGSIVDMQAAESSITNAIYALETDCNKNITNLDVSLSGVGTYSRYISDKIKLSHDQAISTNDIRRLFQKMLYSLSSHSQAVIHYFPVEFLIDEQHAVDNPVEMFGKELSCKLHVIMADTALLFNITHCLSKCNIEVNNFILSIYASAIACLSEEEKNVGTILLDIGASTTSIGMVLAGQLVYCNYLNFGSWHITYDIAKVFSISMNAAEKLKVLYGDALLSAADHNFQLRIEDFEPENQYNPNLIITIGQLASVINPRIEEILLMVRTQLESSVIDHMIARYIVITGGGSSLKSLKELANTVFQKPIRIGKANNAAECNNSNSSIYHTSALGMIECHALKQKKLSTSFDTVVLNSWFKRLIASIRANF